MSAERGTEAEEELTFQREDASTAETRDTDRLTAELQEREEKILTKSQEEPEDTHPQKMTATRAVEEEETTDLTPLQATETEEETERESETILTPLPETETEEEPEAHLAIDLEAERLPRKIRNLQREINLIKDIKA